MKPKMTRKLRITNNDDKALADLFDDWRAGLPEKEQIMADHAIDKLVGSIRNMGVQSAKVILAHSIARMKPVTENEREK